MSTHSSNFYYKFAVASCMLSAFTTISLLVIVPLLCAKSSWDKNLIAMRSDHFRVEMNRLWTQMYGDESNYNINKSSADSFVPAAIYFSKVKRSPWDKHVCSECNQLSCPVGMPGAPGLSGADGESGASGLPGKSGEDGYDVELAPQDDLPCVICPGGPPGLRGMQGERGQSGPQGVRGDQGVDGRPGAMGSPGLPGKPGSIGVTGKSGPVGPSGETIVAGVGIKGPNGPPGSPGPKGPIGRPGKSSREVGPAGPPGPNGPQGNPGAVGRAGDDGEFGPPGEPGEPAAYCHSDCGVSQILAPSIGDMMMSEVHSADDGSASYNNPSGQQETNAQSYNQNVNPVHSIGISDAYAGYSSATAVQVE